MLFVFGTIAIVAAAIGIGIVIDRKVGLLAAPSDFETDAQRARKQLVSHGAGEAPATALRLRGAQIANLRTAQRCPSCRAAMTAGADDTVRYDERDLLVLHFACGACGTTRSLYIEPVT